MSNKLITYKEYMEDAHNLHQAFYEQFSDQAFVNYVIKVIGAERLLASTDKYLNDIPIKEWDSLGHYARRAMRRNLWNVAHGRPDESKLIFISQAGVVCLLKAAARKFINTRLAQAT